jgi:hypothetical protein
MRDRSLEEFAGGNSKVEGGAARSDVGGEGESDAEEAEREGSDPGPAYSYRWDPTETECPACGTAVRERWRDDGEYVCRACKAW